jgi:hypothetical protein
MGATKAKWQGGQLAYFDGTTYETVAPLAPVVLYDDFLGTVTNTDIWTTINVGAGSTAQAASVLTLTQNVAGATDENGVYGKNDKPFNLDKGPIFECRMAVSVAPTIGSEIIFGLMNDNLTPGAGRILLADELLLYACFGFYTTVGAGLIPVIRTDDTGANSGIISTALTVVVNVYHVYKIDFTDVTNVKFFIDGARVASTTTFSMATGAAVMVQPIITSQKVGVDAGLGTALIDYVKVWQPTR